MKKQHLLKAISILTAGIYVGGVQLALARCATENDSPQYTNYQTRYLYINKDGSSKSISENEIVVKKEDSKSFWAHCPIEYNKTCSDFKILEAKTITNNKTYPIDLKYIEDKPIASTHNTFDQTNRITLAFPKVELNSTIFFKREINVHQSAIENYYSNIITYDNNGYIKSDLTHIVSELPLYLEINDPDNILDIQQERKKEKNKTLHLLKIEIKKPFIYGIVDERNNIINPQNMPYVCISSIKNWPDLGQSLASSYEKIKHEKLPSLYQEIADIAKLQKTPIQKINTVTSLLSDKLTYLSDLRTIKGRMIPQHLEEVANTHLGDCKDFSMATSVILESIGISSKLALVNRGEKRLPFSLKLANSSHFNHAIVKVELPNQTLWIDPTNMQSMADNIFPDIANRQALVLDINNSYLDTIPSINPKSNIISIREKWDMQEPPTLQVKGTLKVSGDAARAMTGYQKIVSNETIKNIVANTINDNYGQILEKDITLPPLTSKIVEDLSFDYSLKARNSGVQTNAGVAVSMLFNNLNKFQTKKDDVSEIYLGAPHIIDIHRTINHIKPQGTKSLNCDIKSPWVDFMRTVEYKDNQMVVHQKMELKKSWLTGKELQSPEYQTLQLALDKHVHKGIAIIFEPDSTHVQ